MKQQEILYNQTYLAQLLERKLRRAQGERSDDEKKVLQTKINSLNDEMDSWKRKILQVNGQYRHAVDEVRKAKRLFTNVNKDKACMDEELAELDLYLQNSHTHFAVLVHEKEEMMVDENILRLELRKLQSFLHERTDQVLSLEARHAQMELALEERTKEMEIHRDMLRGYLKIAEQERAKIASELRERLTRVSKMKNKYEVLMSVFGLQNEEFDEDAGQVIILVEATMVITIEISIYFISLN